MSKRVRDNKQDQPYYEVDGTDSEEEENIYNNLSKEILELKEKLKNKKLEKEKLDKIKELKNIIKLQKDEIKDLKISNMIGSKREKGLEEIVGYQRERINLFENKSSIQQQQQQQPSQQDIQNVQYTTVKLSFKDYSKRFNDKEKYIDVFLLIKNTESLHQALDKFFIEQCMPPYYYRYLVDGTKSLKTFEDCKNGNGILEVDALCRQ